MLMRMVDATAFGSFDALCLPDSSDFSPQTLAASFQVMPARSQSSLVRAWLKLSATPDSGIGCATWGSGIASAAAPQTLAASFQVIPALSQSSLLKGCRKISVEYAMHTFALSFHAISP